MYTTTFQTIVNVSGHGHLKCGSRWILGKGWNWSGLPLISRSSEKCKWILLRRIRVARIWNKTEIAWYWLYHFDSGVTSNFGPPQDLKNRLPIPHLVLYGLKMGPFGPLFAWAPCSCGPCGPIVIVLLATANTSIQIGQVTPLATVLWYKCQQIREHHSAQVSNYLHSVQNVWFEVSSRTIWIKPEFKTDENYPLNIKHKSS